MFCPQSTPAPARGTGSNLGFADWTNQSNPVGMNTLNVNPAAGPTRQKTPQGLETRARILEAAAGIIVTKGYAALTMAALRKAAHVSSASLYHHFENKSAILTACLAHILHKSATTLAEMGEADRAAKPAPQTAFIGFANFIAAAKTHRGQHQDNPAALLNAVIEAQGASPDLAGAAQRGHAFAKDMISEEWSRYLGGADGAFFAHVQLAFAGYLSQLGRCDAPATVQDSAFTSYARALLLGVTAARPDFLSDPQMAAAKGAADQAMQKPKSA